MLMIIYFTCKGFHAELGGVVTFRMNIYNKESVQLKIWMVASMCNKGDQ